MKSAIRQIFLAQRQQLSNQQQQQAAVDIAAQVIALPEFKQAKHIALYHAVQGEVSTQPIFTAAMAAGKHCYLPVITDYQQCKMAFYAYTESTQWRRNRFGIAEPDAEKISPIDNEALDMICVPVVAFNRQCHRLGMGAGFYDRWISSCVKRPFCFGVAYDFQLCEDLVAEEWDQALSCVVTSHHRY